MSRWLLTCLGLLVVTATATGCHGVNPFAADVGASVVDGKVVRAPYMSQLSYFGRFAKNREETIYFWLPMSTEELGVRLISGAVGKVPSEKHRDVMEPAYLEQQKDQSCFDPTIELQRCLTVLEPQNLKDPCGQWVSLGQNDDSVELPQSRHGMVVGSLLRVNNSSSDPLKSVNRGLYRVVIQGAKQTTPIGNFVLQLGAPVLLDAVAMARTPEALQSAMSSSALSHEDVHSQDVQKAFEGNSIGTTAPLEPATRRVD